MEVQRRLHEQLEVGLILLKSLFFPLLVTYIECLGVVWITAMYDLGENKIFGLFWFGLGNDNLQEYAG